MHSFHISPVDPEAQSGAKQYKNNDGNARTEQGCMENFFVLYVVGDCYMYLNRDRFEELMPAPGMRAGHHCSRFLTSSKCLKIHQTVGHPASGYLLIFKSKQASKRSHRELYNFHFILLTTNYRLVLSDGGTYQEAIAASKAAEMFSGGVFKRFSIVRLTSWVMAPINNLK